MIFNKRRPRAIVSKPAVRMEENAMSRAHYVAKELMFRYKTDPRFVKTELSVDSSGPFVKFYQRTNDIVPEYTNNGTRVISFCRDEAKLTSDADFWGNVRY